jgi:hypothetical protein
VPSLKSKAGVEFGGFTRELLTILQACLDCAILLDLNLTITSGSDGTHMKGSRHYTHQAIDLRSKNLTEAQKSKLGSLLRAKLGPRYLVLLEAKGKPNEHFHIELD